MKKTLIIATALAAFATPAVAMGLTGYRWSVRQLLTFPVAPPPYVPPKKRGPKPKTVLEAVAA